MLGDIPAGGRSEIEQWGRVPGWSTPNYAKILEMLMAPLRELEQRRLLAMRAQTEAQAELARRGTNLTLADLNEQREQARRNLKNVLAAQGMYDSGAKDYGMQKTERLFKRQSQSAGNSLDQLLASLANSLANAEMESQQGLMSQEQALKPTVLAQNQPTWGYDWLNSIMPPRPV